MLAKTLSSLAGVLEAVLFDDVPMGRQAALLADWQPDRPENYCRRCGCSVGPGQSTRDGCSRCRSVRLPWDQCLRLGAYRKPLASWLIQMKFARRWRWCRWMGEELARAYVRQVESSGPSVVTSVPLHWRRRLQRGYDQAELLARRLAGQVGLPYARLLRRRRATASQSLLHSKAARHANVHGAFTPAAVDLHGWSVVLVDDVMTSGSTAAQCARLLRRSGAARVILAVVAVADPHDTNFQTA